MVVEPTITMGAIVSAIVSGTAVLASAFGINGAIRKRHRENQDDAQNREDRLLGVIGAKHDGFEDRLKTVEVATRDFMPKSEIMGLIAHEKGNRQQIADGQQRQIDRLVDATGEMKVDLGRLRERHDGIAADVGEIKAIVKEQGRDTAARLDRLAAAVAGQVPRS